MDLSFHQFRYSALYYAAINSHIKVIQILVEWNVNLNIWDNFGRTAMYHAAISRYISPIKPLKRAGADILL